MKKTQALFATLVLLFGINIGSVADFNDGLNAYNKGDYNTALHEWKLLAEQGDVEAQYNLGWMYLSGKGALKDDKESVKWYRRAAEQGDVEAQYNLGVMYANGNGVLKDLSKAKYWIKKASENPDANTGIRELAEKGWNLFELWKY